MTLENPQTSTKEGEMEYCIPYVLSLAETGGEIWARGNLLSKGSKSNWALNTYLAHEGWVLPCGSLESCRDTQDLASQGALSIARTVMGKGEGEAFAMLGSMSTQ